MASLYKSVLLLAAVAALAFQTCPGVCGQGLPVEFGLLGLGDLTTSDQAGPYSIPDVQAFEVEAALAAKTGAPGGPFTDRDVLNFLANTECLEATFNTFAAFGAGLPQSLKPGNVIGGRRANLSPEVQSWAEEVALDEQGHVRMVRQVLGLDASVPCPTLDLTGGFQSYFDRALNKSSSPPFDPYKNDVNFLLATFSLEEVGATGDKGCILLATNPGVANAISGLATSASYQSGVDRHFLWQRRNETVPEYNMTVQEIVLGISNFRDEMDGPAETDQPLYNGNPNFIAVPSRNINLVPTDIRGLTFSRTPQQVLRIVTLGSDDGRGGFFPEGVNGRINTTAGYNTSANANGGYPGNQVTVRSLAEVNKTGLLNTNITVVTPPPPEVAAEASGNEYVQGNTTAGAGSNAPSASPAPAENTSGTTTSPAPPAADNTTTASPAPAAENTTGTTTSPAPAENTSSPAPTAENTTTASPAPAENTTGTTASPAPTAENTTTASPAPAENITGTTTSPTPVAENITGTTASPAPATENTSGTTASPSPSPATTDIITAPANNGRTATTAVEPVAEAGRPAGGSVGRRLAM